MYSYFEQGLRTPKVEILINIAKMYDVTLDELVRKEQKMAGLHGVEFDGITFGMEIEKSGKAYSYFKKNVKSEKAIDFMGKEIVILAVPYLALAAIMKEAHWLITELKEFQKFTIDGFKDGEEIYVRYSDEPIDFSKRQEQIWGKE